MSGAFVQIVLLGAVLVCVLDTALSVISLQTQIPYASFIPLSVLLVCIFGFITARRCGLLFAPLCGAILGVTDSTIGWAISWNIEGGQTDVQLSPFEIGTTIATVVTMDSIFGLIGGLVSKLFTPQSR